MGELELAWRMLPNQFIAITGTNGKTTTVELVGHIHRQAGLPVALAGNVGAALSGLVGNIDHRVTVVCEASSFQLQDTLAFAPEAALLLNITPDHLDRHASLEDYRAAKLQIFARQEESDLAVLACDAPISPGGRARRVRFGSCEDALVRERDTRLWWRGEALLELSELSLRGAHNVQNAMAAAAVCLERGVPIDAVRAGLKSFPGVAHRLQEITRRGGVIFINDSKATNVASTRVALAAFADTHVHLILGGQGKGQDFTALAQSVKSTCRAVYLIGQDAPLIASALANSGVALHHSGDLAHAVAQASQAALEGEVVLLSPGCASFDQFEDFEARGERFIELVGG
jgi:UDP-N-acetylmuramoylalanine--D-glutamate ligase